MLVDTHCHLDFEAFDDDREAVIAAAQAAGVTRILNPGVDLQNSAATAALAASQPGVYAAVGVHPNDSASWDESSPGRLAELAGRPKVVAIGEIGLDYYWDKAPKPQQHKVLQAQLALAAELGLPVIIHNREASQDVLAILLEWQAGLAAVGSPLAERPGVLHSFSGDRDMAEKAVAAAFFVGLTGPLTFKKAIELQTLAAELPLEKLLVETDSPFLSPHPRRGQRNHPAQVRLVAEKLAELRGVPFEQVAQATTANAERLFRFEDA
ncbi:MAG: TatD family hydrolase [Anaerolineales bacterium]|nr:TatD family hydrolase [Anaerolineales bacterium]